MRTRSLSLSITHTHTYGLSRTYSPLQPFFITTRPVVVTCGLVLDQEPLLHPSPPHLKRKLQITDQELKLQFLVCGLNPSIFWTFLLFSFAFLSFYVLQPITFVLHFLASLSLSFSHPILRQVYATLSWHPQVRVASVTVFFFKKKYSLYLYHLWKP